MKKLYTGFRMCILLITCAFTSETLLAQCPGGYTQAQLNWDNLDFLSSTSSSYTNYYPSSSFPFSQNFELGTVTTNITLASTYVLYGEVPDHTGNVTVGGIPYTGDDVRLRPTVSGDDIVIDFETEVRNASFTIYSIDGSASYQVSAVDGIGLPLIVGTTLQSPTILSVSGLTSKTVTASATTLADNDNQGTVTFDIAGPVKTITIHCVNYGSSGSNRYIYLSDLTACVTGSFPSNYHSFSQPFTGQPSYVLLVLDNVFYYVNTANGEAHYLFDDPSHTNMNSVGYDPANRIIYYTYSLTSSPKDDRVVRKYDVNTGTISVIIPDVQSLGVSTYQPGVESGAAAFYDGSLYLGIEGYNTSGTGSGRKSCVWKIDFDGSLNPTGASQVYGSLADNGSSRTNIHDWSDFTIESGVLYDFDGSVSSMDIFHYDMMTGQLVNSYAPVWRPSQVSVDWNGTPYQIDGNIVPYNNDGTVDSTKLYPININGTPLSGSWGDAGGAFRPFCDFGDAPASYDPIALSPAVNEMDTALRIGATTDIEWNKTSSVMADADAGDEDGLAYVQIFNPGYGNYLNQVSVYNNTGSDATLCAWLDYNGNGVFDASEAIAPITVSSMASDQLIYLYWPSITSSLVKGSTTYLRIRMTSAANGMTTANATGYFPDGETEDYQVLVDDFPLPVNLLSFNAALQADQTAKLSWSANEDVNSVGYTLQRSDDGRSWTDLSFVVAHKDAGINKYEFIDHDLNSGKTYYRLKLADGNGAGKYSETRIVRRSTDQLSVSISPNPVSDLAKITISHLKSPETVTLKIFSLSGNEMFSQTFPVSNGTGQIEIPVNKKWPAGTYLVRVNTGEEQISKKLIIRQ